MRKASYIFYSSIPSKNSLIDPLSTNRYCFLDHCADGLKNQDEEDVDCGGTACLACALKNSKYNNVSVLNRISLNLYLLY